MEEPEPRTGDHQEELSIAEGREIQENVNGVAPEANSSTHQEKEQKREVPIIELASGESNHAETPSNRKRDEKGPIAELRSPDRISKDQRNSG